MRERDCVVTYCSEGIEFRRSWKFDVPTRISALLGRVVGNKYNGSELYLTHAVFIPSASIFPSSISGSNAELMQFLLKFIWPVGLYSFHKRGALAVALLVWYELDLDLEQFQLEC